MKEGVGLGEVVSTDKDGRPIFGLAHFDDFFSVFSTCVGGPLWLGLLSSWAPEVENQFFFTDPGSAGNIIPHV